MNPELELKLQEWVDGELSEAEARRIATFVTKDKEAQALVDELRMTKQALADHESEMRLPETREFYWSKIQRQIDRLEKEPAPARSLPWFLAWRSLLAPLSGVALVAFVSVVSLNLFQRSPTEDAFLQMVEVQNPSEHIGSISYKSQAENMFVVWLYDKNQEAESDSEAEPVDDGVLQ